MTIFTQRAGIDLHTTAEDISRHLAVIKHAAQQSPEDCTQITAIGIGSSGEWLIKHFAKNISGVTCHGIHFTPHIFGNEKANTLADDIQSSDLLFICSVFDDEYCKFIFNHCAEMAKKAGVLTVAVIPDGGYIKKLCPGFLSQNSEDIDILFRVSSESLGENIGLAKNHADSNAGWSGFALRYTINIISQMILQTGMICIDFSDIKLILSSGKDGRMGVGVAKDKKRGALAASQAIERLVDQHVNMGEVNGVLACINGSSLMTMDDYEDASRVIHEQIHDDANIIIGLLQDDQLGNYVKVTIMTVENRPLPESEESSSHNITGVRG